MAQRVKAQIAYFSMDPHNDLVRNHTQAGGLAAIYENGYLSILKGDWLLRIEQAEKVPLTMGGLAPFQIAKLPWQPALPPLPRGSISSTSGQAAAHLPGFYGARPLDGVNLFNLGKYHALVDYAHNAASYEALGGFREKLARSSHRRGRWPWRPSG